MVGAAGGGAGGSAQQQQQQPLGSPAPAGASPSTYPLVGSPPAYPTIRGPGVVYPSDKPPSPGSESHIMLGSPRFPPLHQAGPPPPPASAAPPAPPVAGPYAAYPYAPGAGVPPPGRRVAWGSEVHGSFGESGGGGGPSPSQYGGLPPQQQYIPWGRAGSAGGGGPGPGAGNPWAGGVIGGSGGGLRRSYHDAPAAAGRGPPEEWYYAGTPEQQRAGWGVPPPPMARPEVLKASREWVGDFGHMDGPRCVCKERLLRLRAGRYAGIPQGNSTGDREGWM